MNQKQSRIALTLFFALLVAITALLTFGLVPRITSMKAKSRDEIPRWKCIEIVSGDLIRVVCDEETNLVHVAGIESPPPMRNRNLERMARERVLSVDELLERAQIARKSLTTWVYRRTVRVVALPGLPRTRDDAVEAYVEVSGVDVGKKMLQNGQAYATDVDHDRADEYRRYADGAQAAGKGLWRGGDE